jgi:FAD/FMN-containing dehydrogenase
MTMAQLRMFAFIAVVFGVLIPTGTAAPTTATKLACSQLSQSLPNKVFSPRQRQYKKENGDYWNAGLEELGPACIAMPSSAQDVSKIVTLLNEHENVPFAIKSGGHSPNAGMASVKDGVLIALRNVAGTEYDQKTELATIKPGGVCAFSFK